MIIYEAYNETTVVQFIQEPDAISYANAHNMLVRSANQIIDTPIVNPSDEDWQKFSQVMWDNVSLFGKIVMTANPNGYATLLKVMTDGERGIAAQNALLTAINLLGIVFTEEEKLFINTTLTENNFTIQI